MAASASTTNVLGENRKSALFPTLLVLPLGGTASHQPVTS